MTAAIADRTTASSSAAAARVDRREEPARTRRPRLVAVPDTEPPWEDSPNWHQDARTAGSEVATSPADAPARRAATSVPRPPASTRTPLASQRPVGLPAQAPAAPPRARPDVPPPRRPGRPSPWTTPVRTGATGLPVRRRQSYRVAVISAESVPGWSRESDVGVTMTATAALPPARATAAALTRAVLESLSDCRPLEQLRPHCAPDVFAGLQLAERLGPRGSTHLVTARVCEPADGAVEVSAVFRCADRVRAMAMRLQGVDGRWRITVLQLG